jgi:hypothetical protein
VRIAVQGFRREYVPRDAEPALYDELSRLVTPAAERIFGAAELVAAEFAEASSVDAAIWMSGIPRDSVWEFEDLGVPCAVVDLGPSSVVYLAHTRSVPLLELGPLDEEGRIAAIARWLAGVVSAGVSEDEHRKLEALVLVVQQLIDQLRPVTDELRRDVAQVKAAVETIQLQLRAPRPGRRVLAWALSQISGLAVGLASGVALPYLEELVRAFRW